MAPVFIVVCTGVQVTVSSLEAVCGDAIVEMKSNDGEGWSEASPVGPINQSLSTYVCSIARARDWERPPGPRADWQNIENVSYGEMIVDASKGPPSDAVVVILPE